MANLPEQTAWEAGVYLIEEADPVQGGPEGIDNLPHKHLANRTGYLKQQQDSLKSEIAAARGTYGNLGARLASLETETMQGESGLASTSGKTVTHSLGHINYIVNVVAIQDTGGDLGDLFISKAANAFTVYNTGGFTGSFRYQLMT